MSISFDLYQVLLISYSRQQNCERIFRYSLASCISLEHNVPQKPEQPVIELFERVHHVCNLGAKASCLKYPARLQGFNNNIKNRRCSVVANLTKAWMLCLPTFLSDWYELSILLFGEVGWHNGAFFPNTILLEVLSFGFDTALILNCLCSHARRD